MDFVTGKIYRLCFLDIRKACYTDCIDRDCQDVYSKEPLFHFGKII